MRVQSHVKAAMLPNLSRLLSPRTGRGRATGAGCGCGSKTSEGEKSDEAVPDPDAPDLSPQWRRAYAIANAVAAIERMWGAAEAKKRCLYPHRQPDLKVLSGA